MPIMMLPRWPSFTSLLPHLQVMHLTLIHSHIIVEFNIVLWTDEFLEINQSHGILFSARKEVFGFAFQAFDTFCTCCFCPCSVCFERKISLREIYEFLTE
jgi:hypothetical protein